MKLSTYTLGLGFALVGCMPAAAPSRPQARLTVPTPSAAADGGADFALVEDEALNWLSAEDPRLAARIGMPAPEWMLNRIRTEAVLGEDLNAAVRSGAINIFGFEARDRVLRRVAALVGAEAAHPARDDQDLASRHRHLEAVLIQRLVAQERTRLDDERHLGEASGALVRGLVEALRAPAALDETSGSDEWVADHLRQIQTSLASLSTRGGRRDLDTSLYPLERLVIALQLPKAMRALADLRIAMDSDARPLAEHPDAGDLARRVHAHIGVALDPMDLEGRLARIAASIGMEIDHRSRLSTSIGGMATSSGADIESQARSLVLAVDSCPCERDARVGCVAPSPERSGVCGVLHALSDESSRAAGLIALHDDVTIARTIVASNVLVRAALLSHPPSELVDQWLDTARTRPVFVLGIALAAEVIFASERVDAHLACWQRLGDVPLDIVRQECVKGTH